LRIPVSGFVPAKKFRISLAPSKAPSRRKVVKALRSAAPKVLTLVPNSKPFAPERPLWHLRNNRKSFDRGQKSWPMPGLRAGYDALSWWQQAALRRGATTPSLELNLQTSPKPLTPSAHPPPELGPQAAFSSSPPAWRAHSPHMGAAQPADFERRPHRCGAGGPLGKSSSSIGFVRADQIHMALWKTAQQLGQGPPWRGWSVEAAAAKDVIKADAPAPVAVQIVAAIIKEVQSGRHGPWGDQLPPRKRFLVRGHASSPPR